MRITEPQKKLSEFPSGIKFKYPWRKYQERVLKELEEHLHDNHLHIVAPPGSGKTILGLEVMLRLNKPTLIFAPTIAIRNQWILRFCELFLQVNEVPDWISSDIKNPAFLTVVTYQSLHAACKGEKIDDEEREEEAPEEEIEIEDIAENKVDVIGLLKAQNIGTIVVDEAHHLKNAWWQSLTEVKNAINPTVVGLTATPPYDVTPAEWQRYIDLNGPVDSEISVPELVLEGDLCPHQDYVYFSLPSYDENAKIIEFRSKVAALFEEIKADTALANALEQHPIYQRPSECLEWIYVNLECYSATIIYLNAVGKEITKDHLDVIGDRRFNIPAFSYEWAETLLTFYLYRDAENFTGFEEHQQKIINKLKRNGVLERRRIRLKHNSRITGSLSTSISKLESIENIVDFEHDHLKHDLRMVVLTDYIRKEYLVNDTENNLELKKLGVLPIFEQLRRTNDRGMKIGVLTGSLIIIPVSSLEFFKEVSATYVIEEVSTSVLPYDCNYLIVKSTEQLKHDVVHIITQVFQSGYIEVLIGTKSLLGEGWDAPAINSLILASFVGSYVSSNQMRGRAIRTERKNTDKTGNIWHLVCVDPTEPNGGDDLELLSRRLKAFVGVSLSKEASIENGVNRLNLPEIWIDEDQVDKVNERMMKHAGEREHLKQKWHNALKSGKLLIEEIKVPFPKEKNYKELTSLYYRNTLIYFFAMASSGFVAFAELILDSLLRSVRNIKTLEDLYVMLTIIGISGMLIFGRLFYHTLRMFIKYRDIADDIQQIGEALVRSLKHEGTVHTDVSQLSVVSHLDETGAVYCHLEGGTTFEKSTFIKSLQEIVGPVNNPRYIIIRKSLFLKVLSQKDYHTVPEIIARNKRFAEFFERQWREFVGSCRLVYTRTTEGRKLLLRSRIHSLASEFEDRTERVNKWM